MIIVVRKCQDCPFQRHANDRDRCAVSNPPNRPLEELNDRPSFCPLRREQIIVREFS